MLLINQRILNGLVITLQFLVIMGCSSTTGKRQISNRDTSSVFKLPDPVPLSIQEETRIRTACQSWYDSVLAPKGFNGGILVAKNGNIVFEKYSGTAHIPGHDTITENTALHIASVSKTFTAMATLKLWQDGKLGIDDEYSKYFPAFNYPGVTIRSLLNHRSGLPNYTHFLDNMGWDKTKFATNEDVLDFLITRKAEMADIGPPNIHFAYCNTNYALLALLIEKISGKKYADYLEQTFFTPLQMKNTHVFNISDSAKAAPSYDWRGRPELLNFLDAVYGDKNIYTTVRDLLTWDRALCSHFLFTDETLQQAYAPYSNEKPGIKNYGLGWRMKIYSTGKKIIYHNGWWHGSNAAFVRLLDDTATIIAIGNKFNRTIYHTRILASVFGDYFGPMDEEETELLKTKDEKANHRILKKRTSKTKKKKVKH